ncbi:DUF2793 domain-containing protein [Parvularcula dongshanensis]|uniref:DUF2793 domain-containing protein n=1 Tax=Parvularcula dongshanensis TaxID=1173995 RepID=A0A840I3H0_9PROT|nr:DUF2793 domain-containing protein [Parvularcula dongshanensis]MBB4658728.1 hypothetical protein [Parvularcula dongshanensis]
METTDRHGLPYVIAAQAQKHVTVNETFRALDALVQMSVRSASVASEPTSPLPGDGYILTEEAGGPAWDAFAADAVVVYQDGAWAVFAPTPGMTAYVEDEGTHRVWDGGSWRGMTGGGAAAPQEAAARFGVNAAADDTNRLTVKSDAILHSHDDASGQGSGDVRHTLNKAAAGGTASVVFQSDWSGRAEMGLAGEDDFSFKVSADGNAWSTALRIDRATGAVSFPNTDFGSGGGVTAGEAALTAKAFTDLLRADLVAGGGVLGGNLARTTQIVLYTTTGIVQVASAAERNVVEVYDDGAAYVGRNVRQRLFMSLGEVAVLTGLSAGAVIVSTGGVGGASDTASGSDRSPMPLGLEGFAGRQFFFYAFRRSAGGAGRVFVSAGAVPATVRLLNGAGTAEVDSAALGAFGFAELQTDADAEFQVIADQPIFVGVASGLGGGDVVSDLRLVPPLSTQIIGHARQGYVSALYADTVVSWYLQDGRRGSFTVSPGSPVDLAAETGANSNDYSPEDFVILRASGPISSYSGADGEGGEATPHYPVGALAQRVPVPLATKAQGTGKDSCFALASPHEGTAAIYRSDGSLFATLPLTRQNAVTTPDDQLCPCSARLDGQSMPSDFPGGWIEADVPIYVVMNSSQNEAQFTGGVITYGDEIALPGVTPEEARTEVRRDEAGFLRRRRLGADGAEAWVLC